MMGTTGGEECGECFYARLRLKDILGAHKRRKLVEAQESEVPANQQALPIEKKTEEDEAETDEECTLSPVPLQRCPGVPATPLKRTVVTMRYSYEPPLSPPILTQPPSPMSPVSPVLARIDRNLADAKALEAELKQMERHVVDLTQDEEEDEIDVREFSHPDRRSPDRDHW